MTAPQDAYTPEQLSSLSKYLRLTDYLSASMLYLKDNFLLEQELSRDHIKKRILGHWGTVPGLNFIYACLNILIQRHQQEMQLIVGPGHGYPALLSNLFVEGTLGEFYPDFVFSKAGIGRLLKNFSWPGGFPSHANPETPGVILEGGELGYSLATAFGAAFDNPDLIVTCVVGDGEAETGPTATAWHSNKFLNPKTSGAVLPILHLNRFKISGPTIYGTMADEELVNLFKGYGYDPIVVEGDVLYESMLTALEQSYQKIKEIQRQAREQGTIDKPRWPMIIFISKKGWTGPKEAHGLPIENSFRSHGIPLEHVLEDDEEFGLLKSWLESYNVRELLTPDFKPVFEITSLVPDHDLRLGNSKHANGGSVRQDLVMPDMNQLAVPVTTPTTPVISNTNKLSDYLAELIKLNPTTFRVFCPDETESNKFHSLFNVTQRAYVWPPPFGSADIGPEGRVMEMLSEHTLEGWLEGYILTGRNGIFISYEAFVMIIASMVDQYVKFLKQMDKIKWRKPLPPLNILLTSTAWRQDHNGFSHQNPGFISDALNRHTGKMNVSFPVDANMLLATMEAALKTTNTINVIVNDKRELPQYMTIEEARAAVEHGISRWAWAGNGEDNPDVVFAATGDHPTFETLATMKILKELIPELKTRFVSVSELSCFGIGDNRVACRITLKQFYELFSKDKEIIYSYHGYPEDIKHLIFNHPDTYRFHIHGYIEKGTTTTPFDMKVQNENDRFHLALEAVAYAAQHNDIVRKRKAEIEAYLNTMLEKHKLYIVEHGVDMPEIENFTL